MGLFRRRNRKEVFTYADAMVENAAHMDNVLKEFYILKQKRQRTNEERQRILQLSIRCWKFVNGLGKDLPDKVALPYLLEEGFTAFLPIECGKLREKHIILASTS